MDLAYRHFIVQDPKICGGEPVIRSTRVTVRTVLASLAEGASIGEILEDFPSLDEAAVRAVIAFAAASAAEDFPVRAPEKQLGDEVSEDPDLVLSDFEQLELLETWAEQGPQRPIDA